MSFINPLADLFRYGSVLTGFMAHLVGFAVLVLMWRHSRNRAYFYLALGFGVSLLSRTIYVVITLSGGFVPSRGDVLGVLFRLTTPYANLIASLLMITGFVMLGWRAIKTFKAPRNDPPPLPASSESES